MSDQVSHSGDAASGHDGDGEDAARERVDQLLRWAESELDLLSSAFRTCTPDELDELREAQGVSVLPAAYHEFMRQMGTGGPGSAMFELFPGHDVSFESMMPADEWQGGRSLADEVISDKRYPLELGDSHLVVRVFRAHEVDYIPIDQPDPPVFGFTAGGIEPGQLFDCFTDWIEFRVGRAIKRRFPLRSAHYNG